VIKGWIAAVRREEGRSGSHCLGLLVALAAALVAASVASAAQPAYEPNDSLLTAYGPLGLSQTYTGALETQNDTDFFYFYVNSAAGSQVTLTIKDLGGGLKSYNGASFSIEDSHGRGVAYGSGVDAVGDYHTTNVTLTAGKYYIEVVPYEGYSATYSLTTGGTEGAFGDFAPIAAQCAAATASVVAAQGELGKAESKLKKAGARVRRTRNSRSRVARRRARAAYQKAKVAVTSEKETVKAATKAQEPWCFIPQ
jgi:hypothetical protein